jgi:MoxR-like ATPase
MAGRTHVTLDDIRAVAHPVLTHRIILNFAAAADGVRSTNVIDRVLQTVPVRE